MELLSFDQLTDAVGGAENPINMKDSKLKAEFEKACKSKRMAKIMPLLSELQARGLYGWAKETAALYGIKSF